MFRQGTMDFASKLLKNYLQCNSDTLMIIKLALKVFVWFPVDPSTHLHKPSLQFGIQVFVDVTLLIWLS